MTKTRAPLAAPPQELSDQVAGLRAALKSVLHAFDARTWDDAEAGWPDSTTLSVCLSNPGERAVTLGQVRRARRLL